MIRYFLAKGDRGGQSVIVEGLPNVTCSDPPPRVEIATLGMKTYCAACQREGFIAPMGPRWPGTGPNGMQWALSGDVNRCACEPAPVFYAERGMTMAFSTQEAVALVMAELTASSGTGAIGEEFEHYFELVDAGTGAPVEGMMYKLSHAGRFVVDDARLIAGGTRAVSLRDHPDLLFVVWHAGNAR